MITTIERQRFFMQRPFFTCVIACRNSSQFIERTLDSLVAQKNFNKIEVIIVDDMSTDDTIKKCHKYDNKLFLKYITTSRKVHCPANTKQAGLEIAKGKWITFLDHDDVFTPDAFSFVENYINQNHSEVYIATEQCAYTRTLEEENRVDSPHTSDSFIHGVWYELDWLRKWKINFCVDCQYDDILFNKKVKSMLLGLKQSHYIDLQTGDLRWLDKVTYNWIISESSYGHKMITENNLVDLYSFINAPYIYLDASVKFPQQDKILKTFAISELLDIYFMYQYYMYQPNEYKKQRYSQETILQTLHQFKVTLPEKYNLTGQMICDAIFSNPLIYNENRVAVMISCSPFIEQQSFIEWWNNL